MKLTLEGIKDRAAWQNAGIKLPDYDVQAVSEKAKKHPVWAHFGAGNIFRIFVGGMADAMLEKGAMDRGITCVETFDFDVVDQIYTPYDNLVLAVTLNADATTDKRVLGSLSEAIKAQSNVPENWNRLKAVFADPGLQMISFTITEKGYALKKRPAISSRLCRRISTTARRKRPERWRSSAPCCCIALKTVKRRWPSFRWIIAATMAKNCAAQC